MKKRSIWMLALAFVIALAVGIWLFISPRVEQAQMHQYQDELIESIQHGDGVIVLAEDFAGVDVDYYDTPDTAMPASEDASAVPKESAEVAGIGVLTIESIGLTMPVSDGVSKAQLKVAAGWVPQTAPVGNPGNAVIAGHRNYTYGDHFNRLGEVETGDTIQYTSKTGEIFTYEVYETLVLSPDDPAIFEQPEDAEILSLYTCHPIREATHRLIVRANRLP